MTSQLLQLLSQIGRPRILVLGDVMLDRYTWGDAERVSPEAPVIVLRADQEEVRPGGAASVAYLLRHLDADVTVAGVVGDDRDGHTLRAMLRDEGIDEQLVLVDPTRPTTAKHRSASDFAGGPRIAGSPFGITDHRPVAVIAGPSRRV